MVSPAGPANSIGLLDFCCVSLDCLDPDNTTQTIRFDPHTDRTVSCT